MILNEIIIILVFKMPMGATAGMMIQNLFRHLSKNVIVPVLEMKMKFVVHPGGFQSMARINSL